MDAKSDHFLFEQLPVEINLIILGYIPEADEWIKVSRTCKRWLNNTKFITDLQLEFTRRPVLVPDHNRRAKTRRFKPAPLNLTGIAEYLKRFNPESLRSLGLQPDLRQSCALINDFLVKCTSLRSLEYINASHLYQSYGSLTQLKSLLLYNSPEDGKEFAELLKRLINLERLEFSVAHATWKKIPSKTFYSDLVKLKSLQMDCPTNTYIKFKYIGRITQLTTLEMPHAYIADDEFKHFADLTNLEVLTLNGLQQIIPEDEITMEDSDEGETVVGNQDPLNGLRHLTNLSKLTCLDISNVQIIYGASNETQMDLADLIQRYFPNLKTLKIDSEVLKHQPKLNGIKSLSLITNL